MTTRPVLLALTLATAAALTACGKSEPAAEGAAHAEAPKFTHVTYKDGKVAAGEALYQKKFAGQACVDCHGPAGGKPTDPMYPVLAGQYADYLYVALKAYRDGDRTHPQMAGVMKNGVDAGSMKDQDLADLAQYLAAQQGPLGDLQHAQ
jgi:cytochrome c553